MQPAALTTSFIFDPTMRISFALFLLLFFAGFALLAMWTFSSSLSAHETRHATVFRHSTNRTDEGKRFVAVKPPIRTGLRACPRHGQLFQVK
jgi:hypothetical protein